jgi:protein tyrosine phosphatase
MNLLESIESDLAKLVGELEVVVESPLYSIKPYATWVDPSKLMRGSRLDNTKAYQMLKDAGFTAILDLRKERCDAWFGSVGVGLRTLWIPILDGDIPTDGQCQSFLRDMQESDGPIYMHCEAGVGRTGCMVALYRVKVQGWNAQDALKEAESFGTLIPIQTEFILSLK